MNPEILTQLGVGGMIALLIVKMVLDYLIKKKNNNSCPDVMLQQILDKLNHIAEVTDKIHERILEKLN